MLWGVVKFCVVLRCAGICHSVLTNSLDIGFEGSFSICCVPQISELHQDLIFLLKMTITWRQCLGLKELIVNIVDHYYFFFFYIFFF